MNNSVNSNIYDYNARQILDRFQDHVIGDPNSTVLVISTNDVNDLVEKAIDNSVRRLGLEDGPSTWVKLAGNGKDASEIDPEDLLTIIEGMDPVVLIALDAKSSDALSRTYRQELKLDDMNSIRGRRSAIFKDFPKMLEDDSQKQIAWAVLKRLKWTF